MGILLFELFRNPLFMGILNKWETLAIKCSEGELKLAQLTGPLVTISWYFS